MIDALDADSDNDGHPDAEEAGDDNLDTPPLNTDEGHPTRSDDIPNYIDDDSDGDEVLDITDNCILVENADQLDQDMDGAGDICENNIDGDMHPTTSTTVRRRRTTTRPTTTTTTSGTSATRTTTTTTSRT